MKIAHVAPFAPNRCGLYEAARDMARADIFGGNTVVFVDAGISKNGKREAGQIGVVDNRGDFKLTTSDPSMINDVDIIIMHTGVSDSWLVQNQIPLIWAVHGRPLACFRPERMGKGSSYSLYNTLATWKRTRGMLYFWKEFEPHWSPIFQGKDIVLDYPVIDEKRFNSKGKIFELQNKGDVNILICDSEREDVDCYESVIGFLHYIKTNPNEKVKLHMCGLDMTNNDLPNCWNIILGKIKELGCLGDVYSRVGNMEQVYRAVDCVISPNKIITRTIGEALSCGTPVISQNNSNNLVCDYTCDMSDVNDVIEAITFFMKDFKQGHTDREKIIERSKVFSLETYSKRMNEEYSKILGWSK